LVDNCPRCGCTCLQITQGTTSCCEYYTYFWLREDFTPYYVGKGKGNRAFVSSDHNVYRPKDPDRIVIQYHPSELEAFEVEIFFISFFGRKDNETGILRNMTDGGVGGQTWSNILSPESRKKGADKRRGRKYPGKSGKLWKVGEQSVEHRRKNRQANLRAPRCRVCYYCFKSFIPKAFMIEQVFCSLKCNRKARKITSPKTTKNWKWITDGQQNKLLPGDLLIVPEGWRQGSTQRKKKAA
jgi:hypothetical protein